MAVHLLGTGIGIQFYYLMGVALTILFVGAEHLALIWTSAVTAAGLVIVVQATAPYDTGAQPASMFYASMAINAAVSCGTLLLIVSYALREAARAEAVAEREFERSERLLTNILPSPIAAGLRTQEQSWGCHRRQIRRGVHPIR